MDAKILAEIVGASFPAMFIVLMVLLPVFAMRKPSVPYLKRVAKKYSISPLNLR